MAKRGKPNPKVKDALDRIRRLNERIVDAAKNSSEESLKTYERVLENLADATEAAGKRGPDWIKEFAHSQADFTRKIAEAFPSLMERAGLHTKEVPETATANVHEDDLPIPGYDGLGVHQINQKLDGLSQKELGKIDAYEARTKNRKTIRNRIQRLRR
jgi:hypothetical protein